MTTTVWLERVLVLGSGPPTTGQATVTSSTLASYDYTTKVITIRRPGVKLDTEWSLTVQGGGGDVFTDIYSPFFSCMRDLSDILCCEIETMFYSGNEI